MEGQGPVIYGQTIIKLQHSDIQHKTKDTTLITKDGFKGVQGTAS